MTEIYVVLGFSLLLIIGFGVIMLLIFRTMSRMSGDSLRGEAGERRDFLQVFERIIESTTTRNIEMMAQVHRDERMAHIDNDTKVAIEAVKPNRSKIKDLSRDEVYADPNELEVHGSDGGFG